MSVWRRRHTLSYILRCLQFFRTIAFYLHWLTLTLNQLTGCPRSLTLIFQNSVHFSRSTPAPFPHFHPSHVGRDPTGTASCWDSRGVALAFTMMCAGLPRRALRDRRTEAGQFGWIFSARSTDAARILNDRRSPPDAPFKLSRLS